MKTIGPAATAKLLNSTDRAIYARRERLEQRLGVSIAVHATGTRPGNRIEAHHPHRIDLKVENGIVLVGSDAHIWPGDQPVALRAFVKFCKELKPAAVIMNGDVMDFPNISRHPPIGWEKLPNVADEIESAKDTLHEIEKGTPRNCQLVWNLGNHDARFETRLAQLAPEYAKVHGVHLRDHFPHWKPAWAAWINSDVVVKHRFKGGIHAPHNNTLWAGKTMVTGHLHSAKVIPLSDYNGTRYGVDTGCLADVEAKAFVDYTEDAPKNWRSGFGVLTFKNGRLFQPELVLKVDSNHVEFRGELIKA